MGVLSMIDLESFRDSFLSGWKESFNGIETYKNVLLLISFMSIGAVLGIMYIVQVIIYASGSYATLNSEAIQEITIVTRQSIAACISLCLICMTMHMVLTVQFPE